MTWYTWLEQGRDINASPQVLDAVARTLLPYPHERAHLFRLADAPDGAAEQDCQSLPPTVRALLDQLDPYPACVALRTWTSWPGMTLTPPDGRPRRARCEEQELALARVHEHQALPGGHAQLAARPGGWSPSTAPRWRSAWPNHHLEVGRPGCPPPRRSSLSCGSGEITAPDMTKRYLHPRGGTAPAELHPPVGRPAVRHRMTTYTPAGPDTEARLHELHELHDRRRTRPAG